MPGRTSPYQRAPEPEPNLGSLIRVRLSVEASGSTIRVVPIPPLFLFLSSIPVVRLSAGLCGFITSAFLLQFLNSLA
jgi:hypothetical protein